MLRAAAVLLVCAAIVGCTESKPKSDAELGLNPQQSSGRRVYDAHCLACHSAYSRSGKNGPSLQGIFKKPFFPSGTPANDERMVDIVVMGRPMMPAFRNQLTGQEMKELLAYLHTL